MFVVISIVLFGILPYCLTGNVVEYTSNGYKLTIDNKDDSFSDETRQHLINTYFKVMPEMNNYFGQNQRNVRLTVDPNYKGAAATSGSNIVLGAEFIRNNPEDYDAVTHEFAHVVQNYPTYDPNWLVEGIADWARYKWGVNNEKGGWQLPNFNSDQKYTDSYRVTARFLVWLERSKNRDIVKQLDQALRSNSYSEQSWNVFVGKSLQELWSEYLQNPAI